MIVILVGMAVFVGDLVVIINGSFHLTNIVVVVDPLLGIFIVVISVVSMVFFIVGVAVINTLAVVDVVICIFVVGASALYVGIVDNCVVVDVGIG